MAVMDMNESELQQALNGDKPVLVEFWAPWCGYCRRLAPIYESVAEEYGHRLTAVKINIDEEEGLTRKTGVEIIPTLVLYQGGRAVDSVVNPGSKAAVEQFLQRALTV